MPAQSILIKNGQVVTEKEIRKEDLLIVGEIIAERGNLPGITADTTFDAKGLYVLPGAVDTHVHFNDEFMGTVSVHDYDTGTRAAAFGGVTSVIDFSNQAPGATLLSTISQKQAEARGKALIDWGVHPVITQPTPATLDEIPAVIAAGAPTIKCYMTYRTEGLLIEDKDLENIAARLIEGNGMLLLHAEDNDMIEANVPRMIAAGLTAPIHHAVSRPPEAENEAIRRCVAIARRSGGRLFIVHMATDQGISLLADAREQGVDIQAETCTHYLIFTEDMLKRADGIKWICSPPLRTQRVQEALWRALGDGRIAMVSSDDAAFSWQSKLFGKERFDKCPNGIPGIEVRLNLLYSEGVLKDRISLPRMVELTASAPARLFGLAPRKGFLDPGSDADIVLFDPEERWIMGRDSLHMAADWSAYEGIPVTGKIKKVFSRGELIIDGENCAAVKGRGRYLHRRILN